MHIHMETVMVSNSMWIGNLRERMDLSPFLLLICSVSLKIQFICVDQDISFSILVCSRYFLMQGNFLMIKIFPYAF